jgi:hypothetical protein
MVIKNKRRDFVTGKKLVKGFELHHCDLRSENYQILDEENFICLNKKTHSCIHWLYPYWLKDPEIIDRLVSVLEKMKEINGERDLERDSL